MHEFNEQCADGADEQLRQSACVERDADSPSVFGSPLVAQTAEGGGAVNR
jgi:hypothetical protein